MRSVDSTVDQRIVRPVMPELDTIRGIAILLVFWFHSFMLFTPSAGAPRWERLFLAGASHGAAGVNLFFVLSGFLITGILFDSVSKSHYYSRFYYRRALRILPAYYLLLLVLFGLGFVPFAHRHNSLAFLGLSFIYLSNMTPLFGVPMQYGPLWSLAVEEHFYLLWPAAVRTLTRRALIIFAASICVLEPFLRIYAVHRIGNLWPYTWLAADGLAFGALLAGFARSSLATRNNLLLISGLAAALASGILALSVAAPYAVAVGIRITSIDLFALFAVSAILWVGTGPFRGWVNLRLLSFYGYISYGLYLIHALFLGLYDNLVRLVAPSLVVGTSFAKGCFRWLFVLALATGVAYVSRITFEEFFLRMKNKSRKVPDRAKAMAATEPALRS